MPFSQARMFAESANPKKKKTGNEDETIAPFLAASRVYIPSVIL